MDSFDYVVVGAGTAGCVLAARLSEDPDARVLLLEAGPDKGPDAMDDPLAVRSLWGSAVDWTYFTTPQVGTEGAVHPWPSGKVLGGSSSINAMLHLRGHQASYDAWERHGAHGWNYASMLPFLKLSESAEGRDAAVRGTTGPMVIESISAPGTLPQAWVRGAEEAGHRFSTDGNGEHVEGLSWSDTNVVAGRRQSAANAYLHPAADRPNLTITSRARVRRLLLDGTHCWGVEFVNGDASQRVRAEREVILTAGAVGSPHLLLLSGIGPAADLKQGGISVNVDLAGVGQNLHDHVISGVSYATKQAMASGAPFNNLPHVLCRTSSAVDPDMQMVLNPSPWSPRWTPTASEGYSIVFALMTPASRGSVRLNGADPEAMPLIDPGYLNDERDLERMAKGLEMARAIGQAHALDAWRSAELSPGPAVNDQESVYRYLSAATTTYFHPVGTCRMGVDDGAVVDPELRVYGIEGLRVADASIMPSIVSANTNATVLAIAERAVSIVRRTDAR